MWFAAVLTVSLSTPAGVEFSSAPWEDVLKQAAKEKKLVFVDFYTDW